MTFPGLIAPLPCALPLGGGRAWVGVKYNRRSTACKACLLLPGTRVQPPCLHEINLIHGWPRCPLNPDSHIRLCESGIKKRVSFSIFNSIFYLPQFSLCKSLYVFILRNSFHSTFDNILFPSPSEGGGCG